MKKFFLNGNDKKKLQKSSSKFNNPVLANAAINVVNCENQLAGSFKEWGKTWGKTSQTLAELDAD
ncbi:MAG: hypothetical protein E7Y34_01305 [Mycoplasma sp.]|nr:hypothetical protein [Mycoplasma sp.]